MKTKESKFNLQDFLTDVKKTLEKGERLNFKTKCIEKIELSKKKFLIINSITTISLILILIVLLFNATLVGSLIGLVGVTTITIIKLKISSLLLYEKSHYEKMYMELIKGEK